MEYRIKTADDDYNNKMNNMTKQDDYLSYTDNTQERQPLGISFNHQSGERMDSSFNDDFKHHKRSEVFKNLQKRREVERERLHQTRKT